MHAQLWLVMIAGDLRAEFELVAKLEKAATDLRVPVGPRTYPRNMLRTVSTVQVLVFDLSVLCRCKPRGSRKKDTEAERGRENRHSGATTAAASPRPFSTLHATMPVAPVLARGG